MCSVTKILDGGIQCKFIQNFCHAFGLSRISLLTPYVYILEYARYVLMMLDALYVLILWYVCMCVFYVSLLYKL